MTRLHTVLLGFSLAFALFIVLPAFLGSPFSLYPLMSWGDVLDIFTPLMLLPLYWLLFQAGRSSEGSHRATLFFVFLGALWVVGQGMHLAANSIGHLLKDVPTSDAYALTEFYDEVLSHYLWHLGIVGLSALLILSHWKASDPSGIRTNALVIVAGVLHGFVLFLILIEAGTAPLMIPFAAVAVVAILGWGRKDLQQKPIIAFFLTAYALSLALTLGWWLYWGGLPQFSEIGII